MKPPVIISSGKMTANEYRYIHRWVAKQLGTPSKCENCLTLEASRFEWANLSGEYIEDISDWARLCRRCHRLIDNNTNFRCPPKSKCGRGHPMVGENVKYRKKRNKLGQYYPSRYCVTCNHIYPENLRLRRKKLLEAL